MNPRRPLRSALAALVLVLVPLGAVAQTPGNEREMAFRPGLGEHRESVPGGRLLVGAYAITLLALGGYVAFVARAAARVETDLRTLEDELERHRARRDGEGAA